MSEDFDSDVVEEDDITPSDSEEMMSDFDEDEFVRDTNTLMPGLLPNQELSPEKQEQMTTQFSKVFTQRYPSSGLKFFQGSLDDALNRSISNPEDPRPLVLYICHSKSDIGNVSCINLFCAPTIVKLLNEEFVIWPWDRTKLDNYRQFLKLLIEKVGSKIASQIASYSYSENQYPLLVCLALKNDQYTIVNIITSEVSDKDMVYNLLCLVRDDFDRQNYQDYITVESQNENWHIPNSHLTSITSESDQFQTIINSLNIEKKKIINISMIENLIWSIQYSCEKRKIDDQNGRSPDEKELFYGCPLSMAKNILQNGFDYDNNRIHGDKCGKGFYFSSERNLCEKYTVSDDYKYDKKAIIKCRILINQNPYIENNSNIFVVSHNEQILPEYLIVYNE